MIRRGQKRALSLARTVRSERQRKFSKLAKVVPTEDPKVKIEKVETKSQSQVKNENGTPVPATGNTLPPPEVKFLASTDVGGKLLHKRIRVLKEGENSGPIVYWMSRDQRVQDNWALVYAAHCAVERAVSLAILFNVPKQYPNMPLRQYDFMLRGLEEVEMKLRGLGIPFFVSLGEASENVCEFVKEQGASLLITDFSPLNTQRQWIREVVRQLPAKVSMHEVDAHNIVPVWVASEKQEWSAATFRRKIYKHLPTYLDEFPEVEPLSDNTRRLSALLRSRIAQGGVTGDRVDWSAIAKKLECDSSVGPLPFVKSGTTAALAILKSFFKARLARYDDARNIPHLNHSSHLSPFLNFGQISAQRVVLDAKRFRSKHSAGYQAFYEQVVVRRELSDNYCYYNPNHDRWEGIPPWAQTTLLLHSKDKREWLYSEEDLAAGRTHDDLWNAAQHELVYTGAMHGYMRMYWGKKILEWTESPKRALELSWKFNDVYALDGRDPNGYVGCAWAIGGVHDRAWGPERSIFGKIRYMNDNGCKRKFSIPDYIDRVSEFVPDSVEAES